LNYPDRIEEKLGFAAIRDLLSSYCETSLGAEKCRTFSFLSDLNQIDQMLHETNEYLSILDFDKKLEYPATRDLRVVLKRVEAPGTSLNPEECLAIRDNYIAVKKILTFFHQTENEEYLVLKKRLVGVKQFPFVQEKMDLVFNKHGHIKDNASAELSLIRRSLAQKAGSLSKRMSKIVEQAQKDGWIDQDATQTVRDGRLVLPVPATHKRRIQGLIHDESATGKTVFLEPIELIEVNNEIRELELAEKREISKILIALTTAIRPYFEDILAWPELVASFDFIRSRAKLSRSWKGNMVNIGADAPMEWKQVRHPRLYLSFKKEKRQVVAQNIQLDDENRILLISGPNAGGKSVCLKTVGLVQYCIQCGILAPMAPGSSTKVFAQIFIDIGDDQSLENDLSTYSSHLLNMKHFLKFANASTLMLIDEFGTGTEPQLGAAIAQAILRGLNQQKGYGVITTHYSNLKHFAANESGIVNGAMLYDAQRLAPLFELEVGKPGSSFAFEIARKIGLPEFVLSEAQEDVGADYIKFDKHLRDIARDKRYWENKRKNIRKNEKKVEDLLSEMEEGVTKLNQDRKDIVLKAKAESAQILSQVNKRIENTIQEIRKHQADKEKTKAARQSLTSFTNEAEQRMDQLKREDYQQVDKIERQITKLNLGERKEKESAPVRTNQDKSVQFVPGLKVKLKGQDAIGEVLEVSSKSVLVRLGQMITSVHPDNVELVSQQMYDQVNKDKPTTTAGNAYYDMEQRRLSFSTNLDVRGLRVDEALEKVQGLIDDAVMFGEHDLRILHGKGDGILRQVVREYLGSNELVGQYRDEDIRFGGSGITVISLDF